LEEAKLNFGKDHDFAVFTAFFELFSFLVFSAYYTHSPTPPHIHPYFSPHNTLHNSPVAIYFSPAAKSVAFLSFSHGFSSAFASAPQPARNLG
jgi:hypothetical protein